MPNSSALSVDVHLDRKQVKVDTRGREEFKTVYHSDGNKAIRFLAAACQFNRACCWPSSFFTVPPPHPPFLLRDSLALFVSVFPPHLCSPLAGITGSSGSHFGGEWLSFSCFFFNPNLRLPPLSLQLHPAYQMHNAWRKYRRCISICH